MKINNITVAEPSLEGVTVTSEPVWSPSTGRNLKGKMVGDVVAFKTTVDVTWSLLSFADLYKIRNAVETGMANGFFSIEYPEVTSTGALTTATKTVYADHIPRTFYSLNEKAQFFKDITISFIEQ